MAASTNFAKAKVMLKPEEILAISAEISLKYAPLIVAKPAGLTRRIALTATELLDISKEITRKFTPKLKPETPKFVLLPIDPNHLYASWNLGSTKERKVQISAEPKREHILRIHPVRNERSVEATQKNWFDVLIEPGKTHQTITVPEDYKAQSYTAAIGTIDRESQFTVQAESKVTYNHPHIKTAYPSENIGSSNGRQPNG